MQLKGVLWLAAVLAAVMVMTAPVQAEEKYIEDLKKDVIPDLPKTKNLKGELMHFGNMGGLMPDIRKKDLPASDSRAAELLQIYCVKCHNLPGPGMRTADEWRHIFWRMYWRLHLTAAQFDEFEAPKFSDAMLMESYLLHFALKPTEFRNVDMEAPGGKEYAKYCFQCHQLPDPKAHTSDEWDDITNRMRGHMRTMGRTAPSAGELASIRKYLKANAAQ